jgi:hypothetical protein
MEKKKKRCKPTSSTQKPPSQQTATATEKPEEAAAKKPALPSGKDEKWWNIGTFGPGDNPHGMVCESSFAVLLPRYREKYIREVCTKLLHKKIGKCSTRPKL